MKRKESKMSELKEKNCNNGGKVTFGYVIKEE